MCPKGDDPKTINQNYRSIQLLVASSGSFDLEGRLGIQFMGTKVEITLGSETTSERCTSELAFHGMFGHVNCEYTYINRLTEVFNITFYSWPTQPLDNNLYTHTGNPSIYDFYCDVTEITRFTTCTFTDVQAHNIRGKLFMHVW